ncbi:MAG: response regulator [Cyanobacteria bacterium J06597_1]
MDREAQQRIMGFFIEEARDHLVNLEQGLLSLQESASDSELINELFRGAHSIKGGAAMLGISSIQHTAHRMEDTFKVFREREVPVDRKLETLLLRCYDTLASLFDKLQSDEGLSPEDGEATLAETEPIFKQLDLHMKVLLGELSPEAAAAQVETAGTAAPPAKKTPSLQDSFQQYVTRLMREMLDLFKQSDSIDTRTRLREIGQSLAQLGETYELPNWATLCQAIDASLAISTHQLPPLARQILPALKQAQQQVLAGTDSAIQVPAELQALTVPVEISVPPVTVTDSQEVPIETISTAPSPADTVAANPTSIETSLIETNPTVHRPLEVAAQDNAAEEVELADLWGSEVEDPGETADSFAISSLASATVSEPDAVPSDESLSALLEATESSIDDTNSANLDPASVEMGIDPLTAQPTAGLSDLFGVDASDGATDDPITSDASDLSALFGSDSSDPTDSDSLAPELSAVPEGAALSADSSDVDFADLFSPETDELDESGETVVEETAEEAEGVAQAESDTSISDGFDDLFSEPEPLHIDTPAADFDLNDDLGLSDMAGDTSSSTSASEPSSIPASHDVDELDLASLLSEPGAEDPVDSVLDIDPVELMDAAPLESIPQPSQTPDAGDPFAGLDDLFDEESSSIPSAAPPLSGDSGSGKPQGTATPQGTSADPFADLDTMMGGSPTAKPAAAPTPAARPSSAAPRRRQKPGFSSPTMRVEVKYLDLINNLVGEMVVSRNSLEQNQARQQQFLENLLFRVRQLGEIGQKMRDRYERSLLEASLLRSTNAIARPSTEGDDAHATGADFDALEMDRFTAFHTLSQEIIELIVRVRESASDIQFVVDQTEQTARQFRQSTSQLQDNLNRARMVPFSQIADRLPRAIRDLSFKTGKQIDLLVEGRDTLIDKAILEELYDPMTHLVNNAIVHGVEEPQVREKCGKAAEGLIKIQTFYQGNQTIIVVSDDGKGIDAARVKEKALAQGLIGEQEAATISDNELYDIIFHAGFSTRSQADELAGRGVGMDVVRTRLNDLRGTVQVDSVPNQGTTFTIRLPLTLSVSKAMVCVSDKALIAFPLDGVEEMVDISLDSVRKDAEGNSFIAWQDQELILKPLTELFSYSNRHSRSHAEVYSSSSYSDDVVPIIILQSGGQRVAVQVDSFVEEQEIVIKQLGGPAPKPLGIAGATVLGDGRVLAIADTLELIDVAHGRTRRDQMRFWMPEGIQEDTTATAEDTTPTVLIVDDSITVRELLSMSFNKVGYKVEQARDGQDAWDKLRNGLPCDLMFCDIEMPRMDGLELLSRMRKEEQYQELPIAMLTSRGADRHRQMASELGANAYFTKPYLEEELLTAAKRLLSGETLLEGVAQAEASQA